MNRQRLIIRLDDAADRMDINQWQHMEDILDHYDIKPLVGVIPDCQDPMFLSYKKDVGFWEKVHKWMDKGWCIAMHGYRHVYDSDIGGINPVNAFSEFAGHSYEEQARRIREGLRILAEHDIHPNVFFAPAHTFDKDTIKALRNESTIRIISDTIAWNTYRYDDFTYVPVQSGRVRNLPFGTVTFCYHPNVLSIEECKRLERFVEKKRDHFVSFEQAVGSPREHNVIDKCLSYMYFVRRKNRQLARGIS